LPDDDSHSEESISGGERRETEIDPSLSGDEKREMGIILIKDPSLIYVIVGMQDSFMRKVYE